MLTNGFSILPAWHPVNNQFEAPITYADEHSTFFVKPDEEAFTAIWEFHGYYILPDIPILSEIPVMVEKPVKGWPPDEILHVDEEVVVSNPWEWSQQIPDINTNYTKVLATKQTFTFGNTEFGTGGKMISDKENTF